MKYVAVKGGVLAVALLAAAMSLAGCKGNELSKQEVNQMQSGPPKEMPPEARAAMERGMQAPPPGPAQQAPR